MDADLKLELHAALVADGLSLKEWLVKRATDYLGERRQPRLIFPAERPDSKNGGAR